MNPSECSSDCPICGGKGIATPGPYSGAVKRISKLSPAEIDALLERSAAGVRDLRETLQKVFRRPSRLIRLR